MQQLQGRVRRHYHVAEAEVRLQRTRDADEDDRGRGEFGCRPFGEHRCGLITVARQREGGPAAVEVPDPEPGAGERVISSTYVWQLRTGRRANPTQKHLSALAASFGVSPMYFFPQTEADRGAVPPEVVAALRNDEGRDMTVRPAQAVLRPPPAPTRPAIHFPG